MKSSFIQEMSVSLSWVIALRKLEIFIREDSLVLNQTTIGVFSPKCVVNGSHVLPIFWHVHWGEVSNTEIYSFLRIERAILFVSHFLSKMICFVSLTQWISTDSLVIDVVGVDWNIRRINWVIILCVASTPLKDHSLTSNTCATPEII